MSLFSKFDDIFKPFSLIKLSKFFVTMVKVTILIKHVYLDFDNENDTKQVYFKEFLKFEGLLMRVFNE